MLATVTTNLATIVTYRRIIQQRATPSIHSLSHLHDWMLPIYIQTLITITTVFTLPLLYLLCYTFHPPIYTRTRNVNTPSLYRTYKTLQDFFPFLLHRKLSTLWFTLTSDPTPFINLYICIYFFGSVMLQCHSYVACTHAHSLWCYLCF